MFKVTEDIINVGVKDHEVDLFEGQYDVPNGMAYNSYVVLDEKVACVITDIEMPQMDGHHLTKLIKSNENMAHIPVIIFSSLINTEMRKKGESLGADMQLSKPEISQLVGAIDEILQIDRAD